MTRSLRDEIRQSRPFQSLEQEAHLNLLRTAAVLTDSLELMLKPFAITLTQFNVLRILRGAEPEGLCRNDLRDRMLTRMPDVSRLLDRMEEAGLVTRQRDADDRRLVTTRISEAGQRLLAELDEQVVEEHRKRLGHLSEEQLRTLIELLSHARESS